MARSLRIAVLIALALGLAPATLANHHQSPPNLELPSSDIEGIYGGTFLCGAGEMGMTLKLDINGWPELDDFPGGICRSGSGPCNDLQNARLAKMRKVSGVINFFPTLGNPSAPKGAFSATGIAEFKTKTLTRLFLYSENWIDESPEFQTSNLEANIVDGKILGAPTAKGCHVLRLHKIMDQ